MNAVRRAIIAVALIVVYTTQVSVWAETATAGSRTVPDEAGPFIPRGGVVIAYAEVEAEGDAKTMAMAVRTLRPNQPADIDPWDADYTCDLIILRNEGGTVRVTGRSSRAIACRGNLLSPHVGTRVMDDSLDLQEDEVTFRNLRDTAFKGMSSYSFRCAAGAWHLSAATSAFSSYGPRGGVTHRKQAISYPKDFGLIRMEDFDPDAIEHVMSKSERVIE